MAAKTDVAGRRVKKAGEAPLASYADKDITPVMTDYVTWLKEQTGYDVDPLSVQLSGVLRGTFQKSSFRQEKLAAREREIVEEREARAKRAEERAARKVERETAKAAKAAEPKAEKPAKAEKPVVKKAAPAAKTAKTAPAAKRPVAKASASAKAAPVARRRPAAAAKGGVEADF